jgi:CRISPR-associated protein (TIGR02584 family)
MSKAAGSRRMEGPHTVLLAILGESPGVLTETVWAMAKEKSARLPDEIAVMTTRKGRGILQAQLLDSGAWEKLRDLLPGLPLPHWQVFPRRADGRELYDLESRADVESAGDAMLRWVRGFAAEPDTRLIASISGGRKSMTALLATCMNLAGKPNDRMVHVHVPPPYDGRLDPPFLFPGSAKQHLDARGKKHAGANVPVTLIDIPFVPLRELFRERMGKAPGRFSDLVNGLSAGSRKTPKLVLRATTGRLELDGQGVPLSPIETKLLAWWWGTRPAPSDWKDSPLKDEEDTRKAASRIRAKLRKAGLPETEIDRLTPRFRKDPPPSRWPPEGVDVN